MADYLHEYGKSYSSSRAIIDSLSSKYGVNIREFVKGRGISSSIILNIQELDSSMLSEFAGNCSALILSDIQGKYGTKYFNIFVDLSLDICLKLSYAILIVSGTNLDMKNDLLTKYGFEIMLDNLVNPHSGRENFFLIKRLEYEGHGG